VITALQTVFYVLAKYGLRRAGDATLTVTVRPPAASRYQRYFIRTSWGNNAPAVSASDVAKVRKETAAHDEKALGRQPNDGMVRLETASFTAGVVLPVRTIWISEVASSQLHPHQLGQQRAGGQRQRCGEGA
jgi:hypothetical protein